MIEYHCEICGKFVRKQWSPAQSRTGNARYCSIKCKFAVVRAQIAQRRATQKRPDSNKVIERYYRARAAGGRMTLRQLAEDTGFSYDYLRKVKRRYDAAGKWGSKP